MSEEGLIKFDLDYIIKKTKNDCIIEEQKATTKIDTIFSIETIPAKKTMIIDKPKLEPNKIIEPKAISKEADENFRNGIAEVRIIQANKSNINELSQDFYQKIIRKTSRIRRKSKKNCLFNLSQNKMKLLHDSNFFKPSLDMKLSHYINRSVSHWFGMGIVGIF
jgi:hypothetical protein